MIRLSVTDLDSYRWWMASEEAELDDLLRRLRRQEPPTEAMMAGRAFHKILETAKDGELSTIEMDGFRFRFDVNDEIALPPVRELKGQITIQTSVGEVTLVGVTDGLHGLTVHDYKFTKSMDAERYANSLQWRSYLVMFNADRFQYDVFVGQQSADDGVYVIREYHAMPFYAYDGMRRDVEQAVDTLAQIVVRHAPDLLKREEVAA